MGAKNVLPDTEESVIRRAPSLPLSLCQGLMLTAHPLHGCVYVVTNGHSSIGYQGKTSVTPLWRQYYRSHYMYLYREGTDFLGWRVSC